MADDLTHRSYHLNDPPARGTSASSGPLSGSDPLAELARLIGQNDPFAEFGREGARRGLPPHPKPAADWRTLPTDAGYAPQTAALDADPYHDDQQAPDYTDPQTPGYEAGLYYSTESHQGGEHDDIYDEGEPPRRRIGVIAIVAVFALAVIGTAGAFTYRAMYGTHGSSGPPPVIKADATPAKIVPAVKSKDPQSSKLIYDRVNERGQAEKIVSREEQPVEIKDKPAGVLAGGQNGSQAPVLGNGVIGAEPKKIHTIAIRPDQLATAGNVPPAEPPVTAQPPVRPTNAAPAKPPAPARPAATHMAATDPAPRPPAPVAVAPPTRNTVPRASANAPLSLNPNAPAEPTTRTAAVAPTQSAPARSGDLSAGSYVQVSAQRSEAEAQTSFRSLQAKYPDQLGGRQATIHRADLGAKGIYFRALIGPFASANEAVDMCTKLKAAGGNCLIQRN